MVSLIIIMICICIYNTVMIIKLKNEYKYKLKNKYLEMQIREEKNTGDKVRSMYNDGRILYHDLKHYLTVVQSLLYEEKYEEAKSSIAKIAGENFKKTNVAYTSSGVINAIINEKETRCESNGIVFDYVITGTMYSQNEMNVAIILANILDNAIEAQEKCCDKRVELEMYQNKGMYNIRVSNAIMESVLEKNPNLNTTKTDNIYHGLGLKSADMLVKEMDGSMYLYENSNKFIVSISFPLINESTY